MRLNPDCLRDVLLIVESSSAFDKIVTMDDFQQSPLFNRYNVDTWLYHIRQASQADLLDGTEFTMDGLFLIKDLTPKGHEFLANIREENNWSKTKHIADKVGSFSISALSTIATNVVTSSIDHYLNH
ncbi:DUF2513 domain-containing protein [Limosilactobacillus fermentum]|uniref:DUF2513 domain-containing protein n=1 Tax=Limosilactobacillus fermentum TaxID=1613 RepID=UPI0010758F8A|nr:DUF2513 domain-containing protein [Limosilactobacillus fermentum]TFZ16261.1 DUF2513 domain-containing protein [Limosilactobacillus fermentum]TFZ16718.1 DUF2513 domain-containing protein [Limosilactobacillus fermentum]